MDAKALFNIGYGLYVLSAHQDGKDNGCIVNAVLQVTDTPKQIVVAANKDGLTHDMVEATGKFTLSVLTEDTPFEIFQRFGMQSGRSADKFAGVETVRGENGIYFLKNTTNAFISAEVKNTIDAGTHTMWVAEVTSAEVLSDKNTVTYTYYQKNIKAAPAKSENKKWVCSLCGYVYEGEGAPPADYICPLCKHDVSYFEEQ